MAPIRSLWLDAYLAWINAWLSNPRSDEDFVMSLGEMASFFHEKNLLQLLDSQILRQIVISFRRNVDSKKGFLGGKVPPSCDETNIITHRYDPRSNCTCSGLYPVPPGATFESVMKQNKCIAVKRMVDMAKLANEREDEWNPRHLFAAEQLNGAVVEFVLSNADEQAPPDACLGPMPSLP